MTFKKVFQWETQLGEPVLLKNDTLGDVTITPQSQALIVRWPYGGWIWNRPRAIFVERGAQIEHIPIPDITRMAQLALFGCSLVFLLFAFLRSWQAKRERRYQDG